MDERTRADAVDALRSVLRLLDDERVNLELIRRRLKQVEFVLGRKPGRVLRPPLAGWEID